jgi:hypothetical protein
MNDMIWTRLTAGTMQCLPDLAHQYWINKLAYPKPNDSVTTYQVLLMGDKCWIHLGATDTFEEAKSIAAKDWGMGLDA